MPLVERGSKWVRGPEVFREVLPIALPKAVFQQRRAAALALMQNFDPD
jgi:hypothetical protein